MHQCSKCGIEKTNDSFSPSHRGWKDKSGIERNRWCKSCKVKRANALAANNPAKQMFQSAKRRAKVSHVPFSLVVDDIKIPVYCPVSGEPLVYGGGDNAPSLDRLVPARGYVPGNVVVISSRINRIKNDASPRLLRTIADWMEQATGATA